MLYWIAPFLEEIWGPFRLLRSHSVLLGLGTILGGFCVWYFLPRLWRRLPVDRGKEVAADGGKASKGKPTGAGFLMALLLLPVIILFMPLRPWDFGVLLFLYLSMLFGYLDDKSAHPWGELKKGLLDLLVAAGGATCFYFGHASELTSWLPFVTYTFTLPPWLYILAATLILWLSTNATNCSDGVDELAGSLTLVSLVAITGFLYVVVGHITFAKYLLIPTQPSAARWAILAAISVGGLAGYLWYNAEPSRVLMGDAGSRMLGFLIGILVLASGNPFLLLMVSPVILLNGGTGLVKLVLLRICRRMGFDTRPPHVRKSAPTQKPVMPGLDILHSVRFPLHDHCRKNLKWSSSQVVMRFVLIQAFLIPILFLILVKIR